MATVIDALVVELGLDPKNFTKGQKEAGAAFLKTRQAAQKEGAAIEKAMDNAGQSLERLARNALKLFAIFTAGRAVKDFVSDITGADAALGRLAKSLETTPEALSSLGGAVARSGGSADAAVGSFQKLSNAYNEVRLTGRSATYDMLARLAGASGKVIQFGKDTQKTIYDTADAAKALSEKSGVSFTTNILEQAGLDPGTIALLLQGSAKLKEAEEKVRRLGGIVSKQDTENAQRFQTALRDVGTISEGLGRTIWTSLSPAISEIIEKITKWYEVNGEWLRTEITEKVKAFGDYLRSIPWEAVGTGIRDFVKGADDAAKAVGGWKVVLEALFGAWLFTKLFALLRVLGLIRLAITGSATPGVFGSLIGALGLGGTAAIGAAVGTAVGADAAVPNAQKPGVTNHWDDEASGAAGGAGMGSALRRGGRWLKRKLGFGGGGEAGGSGEGSRSFRNNNPGNLKYGEFAKRMGATGADSGGFARFPDYASGRKAQESLLFNSDSYKNLTIGQAIARWAPGSDGNDPAGYAAQMAKAAGVGVDTKMSDLTPEQRGKFLDAQQRKEGWIPGSGGGRQVAGSTPPVNGVGGIDQRQGGATRSQPITDVLQRQIATAATAAGVNAEIYSGGQDETGPNRTGSHRHDHGNSADLKLYTTGPDGKRRYLDMTNEADRVVMEKFIRESVKAGANGVGAGPGYMGGRTNMHVGGGSPLAWGAGGASANAPDWLRRAHQQGMEDRLKAAATAAKSAQQTPKAADASKPSAALDDARRAGGAAAVAQANAAHSAMVSRTTNDNRSAQDNRSWSDTHIGSMTIQTAATDGRGIMAELREATKGNKAFAAAADYGKA